ncbi:MAG: hypothetical protein CBD18_00300 [Opitutales bacterium TMED158]|nr:MAG: hypothetical protein CBD18_00300 [Opitutales bacterium TMED158]
MLYVERLFKSLQPLYDQPWFPWALGGIGILFAYSVIKTLRTLPKLVMYPIIGATCAIIFLNWVYYRNEPQLLTPMIDAIAPWLPSRA